MTLDFVVQIFFNSTVSFYTPAIFNWGWGGGVGGGRSAYSITAVRPVHT